VNHSFGAKKVSADVSTRSNAWFVGVAPRRNPDIVVVVLWEHGGWGAGSSVLAAQVIQAYVDKQRRLAHNVLQVTAAPKPEAAPASPAAQPTAEAPAKKTAPTKPTEIGAVWSNPEAPDAMGGRRVRGSRPEDAKRLATVRAGHFFLNHDGESQSAPLVAAGGAH
jgi:penicillin-binding protein 2